MSIIFPIVGIVCCSLSLLLITIAVVQGLKKGCTLTPATVIFAILMILCIAANIVMAVVSK